MSRPSPTLTTKLFYGFGSVAFGVKDNGFGFFLLLYYNQVLGPAGAVGRARHHGRADRRRVPRSASSATSPTTCTRAGDGATPSCTPRRSRSRCRYYLLWTPPAGLSPPGAVRLLRRHRDPRPVLHHLLRDPRARRSCRADDDYDERTSLLGYRFFFGWWGGLTMAVLAFAVFLQPDARAPGRRAEPGRLPPLRHRRVGHHGVRDPDLRARHAPLHPVPAAAAGEAAVRPAAHASRAARDALEPLLPRALRLGDLRRDGGRPDGRAQHLLQHLLLGADLRPRCRSWSGQLLAAAVALAIAPRLSQRLGKKRAAVCDRARPSSCSQPARSSCGSWGCSPRTTRPRLCRSCSCSTSLVITLISSRASSSPR